MGIFLLSKLQGNHLDKVGLSEELETLPTSKKLFSNQEIVPQRAAQNLKKVLVLLEKLSVAFCHRLLLDKF